MELYELIKNYSNSHAMRFHMPGHSGEDIGIDCAMDVTELSFSDNLLEANGVIRDCESRIAKACGVRYALMLTTGGSGGIAAAIYTASKRGKNLIVVGAAHKSVYNYATLLGMNIIRVSYDGYDISYSDIGGIVITSPDYFGRVKDLNKWKKKGAMLIQDSAHGAHFPFSDKLPDGALATADITVASWHKTLPVLTGGAALYTNSEDIYNELLHARAILHTTSPSYMVMSSMDRACSILSKCGNELYEECIDRINRFKSSIADKYTLMPSDDPTRVVISIQGKDGAELARLLEEKNVYIEMHAQDMIVLIVTPYNSIHLEKLSKIMNGIDVNAIGQYNSSFPKALQRVEVTSSQTQYIDITDSVGSVLATEIGTYPPGIPQLFHGDVISREICDYLEEHSSELFGLNGGKIRVYK